MLSQKWPLSSKEIFNALKREHGFSGTYQACHKALLLLSKDGVVVKQGRLFSLSHDWIKKLKTIAVSLEDHFLQNVGMSQLERLHLHGTANVTLIGIRETARFLIDGFFRLPNPDNKPNIALWKNVYSIIGLSDADYSGLKETLHSWHFVSSEDNLVDQMFAQSLRGYGAKVVSGVKEIATSLSDTFVLGDFVGVIFFPPSFRELWAQQNSLPKKVNEFDLQHHLKMMVDEKAVINMVITKNPVLADQIREKYLTYFKEGRK